MARVQSSWASSAVVRERAYTASSPWNQTLAALYPGGVPVADNSYDVLRFLEEEEVSKSDATPTGALDRFLGTNASTFTVPAYDLWDTLASPAYADTVQATPNLIHYWRLGDASAPADDLVGTSNATATGTPTFGQTGLLTGDADTAVEFNGTSNLHATLPSYPLTFSVELWVRVDVDQAAEFVQMTGNKWGIRRDGSTGSTRFEVGGSTVHGDNLPVGEVAHLVMTFDSATGTVTGYRDGVQTVQATGKTNSAPGSLIFYIGSNFNLTVTHNGAVDEVALYDRVLTGDEVAAHYAAGSTAPAAGDVPDATVAYTGTLSYVSDDASSTTNTTGGGTEPHVPIPASFTYPDGTSGPLKPSPGADSEIAIFDWANRRKWFFFGCVTNADGTWQTDVNGAYQCTNVSSVPMDFDAVPPASPDTYASRGSSTPYDAGLVRRWEVEEAIAETGTLGHALAAAVQSTSDTFVAPAQSSDGVLSLANMPPMGARIKLRDDFPIDDTAGPDGADAEAVQALLRTLRDYGMVLVDNSGTSKLYIESDLTAGWDRVFATTAFPDSLLRQVPFDAESFVLVDPAGTSALRDTRTDSVGTAPAAIERVTGVHDNAGVAMSGSFATDTALTPSAGDKLVLVASVRGNDSANLTAVTGNGATWQPVRRYTDPQTTIGYEVWEADAPATPTSDPVTATVNSGGVTLALALRASRYPAGTVIRKVQTSADPDVDQSSPRGNLRGALAGSLVEVHLAHRLRTVSAAAGGLTQVGTTLVAGTAGSQARLSSFDLTTSTAGDVLDIGADLSSTDEWAIAALELVSTSAGGSTHQTAGWQSSYTVAEHQTVAWGSSYQTAEHQTAAWASSYQTAEHQTAGWQSSYSIGGRQTAGWQSSYALAVRQTVAWGSSYRTAEHQATSWASGYTATARGAASWGSSYSIGGRQARAWQSSYQLAEQRTAAWPSGYTLAVRRQARWQASYTLTARHARAWQTRYALTARLARTWASSYALTGHATVAWLSGYATAGSTASPIADLPEFLAVRPHVTRLDVQSRTTRLTVAGVPVSLAVEARDTRLAVAGRDTRAAVEEHATTLAIEPRTTEVTVDG